MGKKLKIALRILPCVVIAILCFISFTAFEEKRFFLTNLIALNSPFFYIAGVLLYPIYIVIVDAMNLVRMDKYAKIYAGMNLVLMVSAWTIFITFLFSCRLQSNVFPAINLFIAIIIYYIIALAAAFCVVLLLKYICINIRDRKFFKATIKILPIPILVIIVVIMQTLFLFVISFNVNDALTVKTVEIFEEIPLPKESEYIETTTFIGRVSGTGNGADLFVAMLIESELSEDELMEYYSKYSYGEEKGRYFVTKQSGQKIENIYGGDVYFEHNLKENKKYFQVYVLGKTVSPFSWFDIRGM